MHRKRDIIVRSSLALFCLGMVVFYVAGAVLGRNYLELAGAAILYIAVPRLARGGWLRGRRPPE